MKNLEHNPYLDMLNVSSNNLIDLVNIHKVIGNIRVLSLSKNNIMDLGDIGKLYSLEKLDLAFNKIPDFSQIQKLSTLPLLTHIVLRGNPIAQYPNYRTTFFSCFHPRSHEVLVFHPTIIFNPQLTDEFYFFSHDSRYFWMMYQLQPLN